VWLYYRTNYYQNERALTQVKIQENIEKLLKSTVFTTPFVGCLLAVCIDHPDIIIPSTLIGDASLKSFNFHTGIILLEKQILHTPSPDDKTPASKKKKPISKDDRQQMWSQLVKLYRKIGEEDILRGVFEKEIARHQFTKDALAAELKGDYNEAFAVYEKATQVLDAGGPWQGGPPTIQEEEHWENARLECLMKLTRWNDLAENTLANVEKNPLLLWDEKNMVRQNCSCINPLRTRT
jgi:DNA-dependent protein kinase catalytic subunit